MKELKIYLGEQLSADNTPETQKKILATVTESPQMQSPLIQWSGNVKNLKPPSYWVFPRRFLMRRCAVVKDRN